MLWLSIKNLFSVELSQKIFLGYCIRLQVIAYSLFYFFKYFFLKDGSRETGRQRHIFHPLVHAPNSCHSRTGIKLKSEASNFWISHGDPGSQALALKPSLVASPGMLAGS